MSFPNLPSLLDFRNKKQKTAFFVSFPNVPSLLDFRNRKQARGALETRRRGALDTTREGFQPPIASRHT